MLCISHGRAGGFNRVVGLIAFPGHDLCNCPGFSVYLFSMFLFSFLLFLVSFLLFVVIVLFRFLHRIFCSAFPPLFVIRLVDVAAEMLPHEEQDVADPLKEYLHFAEALREVVVRQEMLLCDFERSTAAVEAKEREIELVHKPEGLRGFFSNMMSSTEEDKQAKLAVYNRQLEELRTVADGKQAASE